ncbi:hypothetical protein [Castellaniella sp. S9]|uniref:hypothetical protein n=1 Tax=Castellaniella sp. S9 TaxID=2993652 RepID=UPI0022B3D7E3|nr:hypothetical protein [Castellaniella sp. S9]
METTKEVAFYAYDKDRYLLSVRAGVPTETALQYSLELLETAADLLLLGPASTHAVSVMVDAAHAVIAAAIGAEGAPSVDV